MRLAACSISLFTALAVFAGIPAKAGEVKAVIELFTSQGCNSCPPADELLGMLAKEDKFIALSVPVDYWDYLGWRDTLALNEHSLRQKGYSAMRSDRQIYTPQAVINGVTEAIGSNEAAIEKILASTETAKKLNVPIALKHNGTNLDLDIGAGKGEAATVWVLSVSKSVPVVIKKGENRGKTITYSNAVRAWTKVGEWDGKPLKTSLPVANVELGGADTCVVLLQSGTKDMPGAIRGAAIISLR